MNGAFCCDATSGLTIAEPGGDDAGWIPADADGYKCSVTEYELTGVPGYPEIHGQDDCR